MHVDVSQGPHHNWDLMLMAKLCMMMMRMIMIMVKMLNMTTMNMKMMKVVTCDDDDADNVNDDEYEDDDGGDEAVTIVNRCVPGCRFPHDGEVRPGGEGVRRRTGRVSGARLLQQLPLLPTAQGRPGVPAHQVRRSTEPSPSVRR